MKKIYLEQGNGNEKYNDLVAAILMAIAFVIIGAGSARAATYTVTNINDSGAGSLRQAIAAANGTAANDVIAFDDNVFIRRRLSFWTAAS